jgi:hypothetical protein
MREQELMALPQKSSKRLCRPMWGEALPRRRS